MAARKCPMCVTRVPAGHVLAYSDGLNCPKCGQRLEVSAGSRFLATLAGLLTAGLVWHLWGPTEGTYGWVLPVVYAFLAFSVVAPLALIASADLVVKAEEPVAEAAPASHGHSGGHH